MLESYDLRYQLLSFTWPTKQGHSYGFNKTRFPTIQTNPTHFQQQEEHMPIHFNNLSVTLITLALMNPLMGCTTTLVKDKTLSATESRVHCSGEKWVDDSSIAVLPIPVVAFFVPQADLHEIQGESTLQQCGEPARMVNREVTLNRTACIPAGLSRIVTLGIWQWCPVRVNWDADVIVQN